MAVEVDIIIMSNATIPEFVELTNNTITTLLASESPDKIHFNIVVMESCKTQPPFDYPGTHTYYPTEVFGYNRYLNIALKKCKSDYVGICNNDLLFKRGWCSAILNAMEKDPLLLSAGMWCDVFHRQIKHLQKEPEVQYGYTNGLQVTGWGFFVKREIFKQIGPFDEHFVFWYHDNDYSKVLEKFNIRHALITSSEVDHLASTSVIKLGKKTNIKYTIWPQLYYDYKWNHKNILIYYLKMIRLKLKIIFGKIKHIDYDNLS